MKRSTSAFLISTVFAFLASTTSCTLSEMDDLVEGEGYEYYHSVNECCNSYNASPELMNLCASIYMTKARSNGEIRSNYCDWGHINPNDIQNCCIVFLGDNESGINNENYANCAINYLHNRACVE